MFDNIDKFPVLILCSPRSGSDALGFYLETLLRSKGHTNIKFVGEPDFIEHINTNPNLEGLERLYRAYEKTNRFIVKMLYYKFEEFCRQDVKERLLNESYKIRLRRRDVVKQIASNYISRKIKKFHFTREDDSSLIEKPLDMANDAEMLTKLILGYKKTNAMLDNTEINFDLDLYYEDLPPMDTKYVVSKKPANYDEICRNIKLLYDSLESC